MRYRRLDLNLLIALDVLLSEKSVTRAGDRLNLTQPAMSAALSKLREYFVDPLIVKVGRQMELTPLAQSLMNPVQELIVRIDSLIATETSFDPRHSERHFVITASDYVIQVFLREVLVQIHYEAPGITFQFRQSSARVQDELERGEVDFVIGPAIDVHPDHPQQQLFEDTYTVIVWAHSEIIGESLTFDEYTALKHVALGSDRGRPWFDRWFESTYANVRRIDVGATTFDELPQLIIETNRIATIPTRLARRYGSTFPLRLLSPPIEFPRLIEVMQWNVQRDTDPASQWFRNKVKVHSGTLSSP